jgi:PII-like signaling protein
MPVVVEVVDTAEHMKRLEAIVEEMVAEGLVTMEKVRVLKYAPGNRPPSGA